MKFTPSKQKLKINFTIINVPTVFEGSKAQADVEGKLKIYIDKELFFDEENILLLELAISLNDWAKKIKQNEINNFYYESMDYEDEPILAFVNEQEDIWNLRFVWEVFPSKSEIKLTVLTEITQHYINKLKCELKKFFNLDISSLFLNE